ncbi:MAG: hypothetical protein LAT63_06615 [Marinobacter sp.]|nr:hypothetical protein [Marinobacter sp.]
MFKSLCVGNHTWLSAFIILVLPNLLFFLAAERLGVFRPFINIDYVVVLLLILVGFRTTALLLLAALFFIDALNITGQIFPILNLVDVLYLSRFWAVAPPLYQWIVVILGFLLIIKGWAILRLSAGIKPLQGLVLTVAVTSAYIYGLSVEDEPQRKIWRMSGFGPIGSQTMYAVGAHTQGFVMRAGLDAAALVSASQLPATRLWHAEPSQLSHKLVLIVVESWGAVDEPIQNAVMAPLIRQHDQLSWFDTGRLDFQGATVEAELKELCMATPPSFNIGRIVEGFDNCLPARLSNLGYYTFGMHGAAGLMYDRTRWYTRAGFQETLFFEDRLWGRRCYSFPGACDVDMAPYIAEGLAASEKSFVYWLTLNGHSPYDHRDVIFDVFDCGEFDIESGSQTCRNLKLQTQFFQALANLLDDPRLAGAEFIVVGDHQPPIFNKDEFDMYFEEHVVPWVRFGVR